MFEATHFACQWVYQQNLLRFQQLKVLLGSLALWLQVAFMPLLLILPLPMLRLLEPNYDASAQLQSLLVALLCWQSVGRLPAPTRAQRLGWQLLWPTAVQQRMLHLVPAILSQWPFWAWSLLAWGLAAGFAHGELVWASFGLWLAIVTILALLSTRYCPFIVTLCVLPWVIASAREWLPLLLVMEWLCWQGLSMGLQRLQATRGMALASRSLWIGFVSLCWRGQGLMLALVTLVVFCQFQRFDALFAWCMTGALAFACLHGLQAFQLFCQRYSLSCALLWPAQSQRLQYFGWFGVSALILLPWLWMFAPIYQGGWLLLLALSGLGSRPVGTSLFFVGTVVMSVAAYVAA